MTSTNKYDRIVGTIARCNSGAAAVEMAIVFPLFLTVVLGILSYGIYFGAAHSTQQLAADAARASIAGLDAQERAALANGFVHDNAANYPLLWPQKVQSKAEPSATSANDFIVTVTYDASNLPIWGLGHFVPLPTETIERVAVVRRGGQ
jgi:Flp pilus assembly protein TadG